VDAPRVPLRVRLPTSPPTHITLSTTTTTRPRPQLRPRGSGTTTTTTTTNPDHVTDTAGRTRQGKRRATQHRRDGAGLETTNGRVQQGLEMHLEPQVFFLHILIFFILILYMGPETRLGPHYAFPFSSF
jgi:hypothetical protein